MRTIRSRAVMVASTLAAGSALAGAAAAQPLAPQEEGAEIGELESIEDLELEQLLEGEVTVSATLTETRTQRAPASVKVITRGDIERWGYRSVAEVLSHVAGFYVSNDHIIPNAGVRGVSPGLRGESGLIKVMIDGQPVPYRPTAGNWLGPELVPLTAVKRVEIIRGPVSSLYGADAFLGVINIITRAGEDLVGGHVSLNGNHSDPGGVGGGGDLAMGARVGRLDVLLAGRLHHEDRSGLRIPDTSPAARLPTYGRDDPRSSSQTLTSGTGLAKLRVYLDDEDEAHFTLTGYASLLDRGAEFADWLQLGHGLDAGGRSHDNQVSLVQGFVRGELNAPLTENLDLMFGFAAFGGKPTPRDRMEVGSTSFYIERELGFRGFDAEGRVRWQPHESLQLLTGVDFMFDDEQLPSALHVSLQPAPGVAPGEIRESTSVRQSREVFTNTGVYLHGNWDPKLCESEPTDPFDGGEGEGEKTNDLCLDVSAVAGVRVDHHSLFDTQVSGRLGVVLSPLRNLDFKLLYGKAFKAPSPLLLYGVPGRLGDIRGNPDLDPQFVHTVEGIVGYRPLEFLFLESGLAYNYLIDRASFRLDAGDKVARNIAEEATWSWETTVELNYEKMVHVYTNVTAVFGQRDPGGTGYEATIAGNDLVAYPDVVSNTGVSGTLPWAPIRLGVEVSYVSARRASPTNIIENAGAYELDPAVFLGANIGLVGLEALEGRQTTVQLVGRNLTGERSPSPGFSGIDFPAAPRYLMLQLIQDL